MNNSQIKCRDCKRISKSETSKKYLCQDDKGRWNQIQCHSCYEEEQHIPIEYLEKFYLKQWFSSSMLDREHLKKWKESRKSNTEFNLPVVDFINN